jgi:hypothetical protein
MFQNTTTTCTFHYTISVTQKPFKKTYYSDYREINYSVGSWYFHDGTSEILTQNELPSYCKTNLKTSNALNLITQPIFKTLWNSIEEVYLTYPQPSPDENILFYSASASQYLSAAIISQNCINLCRHIFIYLVYLFILFIFLLLFLFFVIVFKGTEKNVPCEYQGDDGIMKYYDPRCRPWFQTAQKGFFSCFFWGYGGFL